MEFFQKSSSYRKKKKSEAVKQYFPKFICQNEILHYTLNKKKIISVHQNSTYSILDQFKKHLYFPELVVSHGFMAHAVPVLCAAIFQYRLDFLTKTRHFIIYTTKIK